MLNRIRTPHNFEKSGKFYWQEVIVLVAGSPHFNETIIKHLEKKFIKIAEDAGRYDVINSNKMLKKEPSGSDNVFDTLEEIVEEAKLLLFHLGHRVLEPQPSTANTAKEDYLYFSRKDKKGGKSEKAIGVRKEDGFWVLKGSFIHSSVADYLTPGYKKLREQYKDLIKKQKLTQNVRFDSPSAASSFVCGKNSNGLTEWKNKDGISLKYLDDDNSPLVKPALPAKGRSKHQTGGREKRETALPSVDEVLHLSVNKYHAEGCRIDDKLFIVLEGSEMNPDVRKSCDDSIVKLRNELIKTGKVKKYLFTENVPFKKPSTAAAVIVGGNSNGWDLWKDNKGRKLKDIIKR